MEFITQSDKISKNLFKKSIVSILAILKVRNDIYEYKYSSHCRDFPDSRNQPGLPRQLKTHIAFSIYLSYTANVWGHFTVGLWFDKLKTLDKHSYCDNSPNCQEKLRS